MRIYYLQFDSNKTVKACENPNLRITIFKGRHNEHKPGQDLDRVGIHQGGVELSRVDVLNLWRVKYSTMIS